MFKKEKRIDIMVDIETLGVSLNSPIFQISAACFDIDTGEILEGYREETGYNKVIFDAYADLSKEKNLNINGGTLTWWIDKYPDMLRDILTRARDTKDCSRMYSRKSLIKAFSVFLQDIPKIFEVEEKDIYLWGNGVNFDNMMLKTQIEALKDDRYIYPIKYYNDMDYRTVMKLAASLLNMDIKEFNTKLLEEYKLINKDFNPHNAMDDVLLQIYKLTRVTKELNIDLKFDKKKDKTTEE